MKRRLKGFSLTMLSIVFALSVVTPVTAFADDELPAAAQEETLSEPENATTGDDSIEAVAEPDAILSAPEEQETEVVVDDSEQQTIVDETAETETPVAALDAPLAPMATSDYFNVTHMLPGHPSGLENVYYVDTEVYDLVGKSDISIAISFPNNDGTVTYAFGRWFAYQTPPEVVPVTAANPVVMSVTGKANDADERAILEAAIPDSFTGTATITLSVDGVQRATTTITGTGTPLSSEKFIDWFSLAGVDGVITETDITVTVPYGTDVTHLGPDCSYRGDINPKGVQDFSSPVIYTVTAEDGSVRSYTVTVTVGPAGASSAKEITSYTLGGVAGTIHTDTNSIVVNFPYGTDITNLTPVVTHTGASSDIVGPYDYTGFVGHYIMAEDGTKKFYVVSVHANGQIPIAKDFDTWTGSGTVTARIDVPLAKFARLLTSDHKLLTVAQDYTAVEGSTVITLTESYLQSLPNGDYILLAEFSGGGEAQLHLKIAVPVPEQPKADPATPAADQSGIGGSSGLPQTGDSPLLPALAGILGVGGLGTLGLSFLRKRQTDKACWQHLAR